MKKINHISQKRSFFWALSFVCILLVGFTLTSCSKEEEDGSWDPMKWKTEVNMDKNGDISAPASGATYVFTCKNYDGFWISGVEEESQNNKKVYYDRRDENCEPARFETQWGTASVLNNQLTVQLSPNQSSTKRNYIVIVTAGDIFFNFTFEQAGI